MRHAAFVLDLSVAEGRLMRTWSEEKLERGSRHFHGINDKHLIFRCVDLSG
jgi:hypothetical protein